MFNLKHPFNHVSIEDVKKEIKELDEQCKGQYLFANSEDKYSLLVDVKNLLDNMKDREIHPSTVVEIINDDDEYEEISFQTWLYDYSGLEYLRGDNSYNWSSPLSHDINFELWGTTETDELYVVVRVHRMGDIRGNYTDEIILQYSSYDDFLYSNIEDTDKFVCVDFNHNEKNYSADIVVNWYRDTVDVRIMDSDSDEEILDLYDLYIHSENKDELISEMKKLLDENM